MKTRFFIYEAYKDEEAVLAHKQTPHYLACVDKLEELMSEPRKKRSFVGLLPGNSMPDDALMRVIGHLAYPLAFWIAMINASEETFPDITLMR